MAPHGGLIFRGSTFAADGRTLLSPSGTQLKLFSANTAEAVGSLDHDADITAVAPHPKEPGQVGNALARIWQLGSGAQGRGAACAWQSAAAARRQCDRHRRRCRCTPRARTALSGCGTTTRGIASRRCTCERQCAAWCVDMGHAHGVPGVPGAPTAARVHGCVNMRRLRPLLALPSLHTHTHTHAAP